MCYSVVARQLSCADGYATWPSQLELTDAQQYIHQLENGRPTSTTFSGGACPASVNEELAAVYKQLRAVGLRIE